MNVLFTVNSDGSVDITGKQGSTWKFILEVKQDNGAVMDLTGYAVRGQIRKAYTSADITKTFTCTILTPASGGKIQYDLSATNTAAITCGKTPKESASSYVYDSEIESAGGDVTRILEGKLFVDAEVTR